MLLKETQGFREILEILEVFLGPLKSLPTQPRLQKVSIKRAFDIHFRADNFESIFKICYKFSYFLNRTSGHEEFRNE